MGDTGTCSVGLQDAAAEQETSTSSGDACTGTLWLLGLRNKPRTKGQEPLAAAASPCCTLPAARGLSPAGHLYQDISRQEQAQNKALKHFNHIVLHSVVAVAPPVTTGEAREGHTSVGAHPRQQAREQDQSHPGP